MRHTKADARPRRAVPRLLRVPLRLLSAAVIVALSLALLPHATRLVGRLWPDPARTTRVSEILRHELADSARLEMITVDDTGVLTSTVNAALIGEVQRVTITYDYHASIGIDLERVEAGLEGGVLTLRLPPFEILSDSLTPTQVDRQDFWYPLTEKRRNQLLSEEQASRAEKALADARSSAELRGSTVQRLRQLIASWLGADSWLITVEILLPEAEEPAVPSASRPAGCAALSCRPAVPLIPL